MRGWLDLIMNGDNEDAKGINSVCVFLGNLYRTEQWGTYGEIKGLWESVDEKKKQKGGIHWLECSTPRRRR